MKCWIFNYINLLPIGNIKVTEFKDLSDLNTIYIGAINKGTIKTILRPDNVLTLKTKMNEIGTDLLTDGHNFYLLNHDLGAIYEVHHYRFTEIYNEIGWTKIDEMMNESENW